MMAAAAKDDDAEDASVAWEDADPGRRPEEDPGRNPALPGRRLPPGRNLGISPAGVVVGGAVDAGEESLSEGAKPGGALLVTLESPVDWDSFAAAASCCSFANLARASSSKRARSAFSSASFLCCSANSAWHQCTMTRFVMNWSIHEYNCYA